MDWVELQSGKQLQEITSDSAASSVDGVVIFKHSTRCGISAMAKRSLEREWTDADSKLPVYLLDLLQHRDLSDQIAQQFSVRHESPQVLVIKGGKCVYNASHHSIEAARIRQALTA